MKRHVITFIFAIFAATFSFAQVEQKEIKSPRAVMEFEEETFDFGTITQGEKVSHLYVFTNTGDQPLIIKDAKGSCGCTVPQYPKVPIMPGETGEFLVEFNSKGKKGMQSKRVTITANTVPAQTYLSIKGEVEATEGDDSVKDVKRWEVVDSKEKAVEKEDWKFYDFTKPKAEDCFAIFPNPTTDFVKVELKEHLGKEANVSIFNASGRRLAMRVVKEVTDEVIEFDVNDYNAGTYYMTIQVGEKTTATKCFVVAK